MTLASITLALAIGVAPENVPNTLAQQRYARIVEAIATGRTAEAQTELEQADFVPSTRARLEGRIALTQGRHVAAAAAFERALKLTPDDGPLRLYLAQAYLESGAPKRALEILGPTEPLAKSILAQPLLHARAYVATGALDQAYATLQAATVNFADNPAPRLELVALCTANDLPHAALAWARSLTDQALDPAATAALAGTLASTPGAQPVLEELLVRAPNDPQVRTAVGYAYAAAGHPYSAAQLFAQAATLGADTAFAAADQYRIAHRTAAALAMNIRVPDRAIGLDQRLNILFDAGDMARVVALEPLLIDPGPLTPEQRYRLAHAHYVLREYARATSLARTLEQTPFAAPAQALLGLMGRSTRP